MLRNEIIHCIVDCRVSDPVQLKGGSLEDQEALGVRLAERNSWIVDKVFKKPHSATTTERDDIEEAIHYIKRRRKEGIFISKYVIKSIDRLTRMGSLEYFPLKERLKEMGVELVDTTGIIQPDMNTLAHLGQSYKWSVYSPSQQAEAFESEKGKAEARDILTRMIGAQIRLVQEGYATRRPPDGFLNKDLIEPETGKKKVIRIPDPERSHFFEKMFLLRAEGISDPEIVARINAMGFRTRVFKRWTKGRARIIGNIGGKPLSIKQLQRYIQKPEYAAIIREKWTNWSPIRAKYGGIVSIELFNRANRGAVYIQELDNGGLQFLHNYSPWGRVKRSRNNPSFPWKCILCSYCKQPLLGSASTGKLGKKHEAYHCGGVKTGTRAHPYFRIRKELLATAMSQYLESLRFQEGFMEGLEDRLTKKYREREREIVKQSSMVNQTVADLKVEQLKYLEALASTDSSIVRQMLESKIEVSQKQIDDAEAQRGTIDMTERSIKGFIRYAKKIMEHPAEIIISTDDLESRKALLSLFFERTPTYDEIVNGTPKLQPLFRLSEDFKQDKSLLVM